MGPAGLSPDNDLGGPGGGSDISNNISCRVRQLQPGQTITVDVRDGSKFSSQEITLNFAEQPALVPLTPTSYPPVVFPTGTTTWNAIRSFANNTAGQGDATVQVSFSVTPPPGPSPGTARAQTFCQCTGDALTPNITVLKRTVDINGILVNTSDNFGFEISPVNPNNIAFDLDTQNNNPETSNTFTVEAGQAYTITETPTDPWTLQSVSCTAGSFGTISPTITNNSITLPELEPTDQVTCEFTNQFPTTTAELTIAKETVDSNGNLLNTSDDFGFEVSPLNPNITFELDTQANNPQSSQTFTVPTGQAYTITETPASSWTLETVTCTIDGGNPFVPTIANNAITLDSLQANQEAECTFRNRFDGGPPTEEGSLEVRKVTIGGDGSFDFTVTGQASFNLRNGENKRFHDIPVGAYTIREVNLPKGWDLQNVSCNKKGKRTRNGITVSVGDGEDVVCTFTNFKNEDEQMEDLTKLYIHRRVDNLLTYGPDRGRILRRLQEEPIRPLKGGPLKYADDEESADDEASASGGIQTPTPYALGVGAAQAHQGLGLGGMSSALSGGRSNSGAFGREGPLWSGGGSASARDQALGIPGPQASTGILSSLGAQFVPLARGQSSFKFGTSLSELRASAAQAEVQAQQKKVNDAGLSFVEYPYLNPYSEIRPGFDVWIEGQYIDYSDDTGGIDREGDFGVFYFGADYTLAPGILVGAIFQIDDTEEDINDPLVRGEIDGIGWMAGPYVGLRLSDFLFFDARFAWGTSDNDIWVTDKAAGSRSGSFDTDRWLASASLTGNHYFGAWRVSPQIGIDYGGESYGTYRNSLSQVVRGDDVDIGRFRGGAELGYRMQTSGGTIVEPTVSLTGLWNFDDGGFTVGGVPVDFDEAWAKLEAGVIVTTPSGWSFRGEGIYDGIGASDFDGYGGQFWVNVPLN